MDNDRSFITVLKVFVADALIICVGNSKGKYASAEGVLAWPGIASFLWELNCMFVLLLMVRSIEGLSHEESQKFMGDLEL